MYGLRTINNLYVEHAGDRGDFVIVGHPEFKRGKIGSQNGIGGGWDLRMPRCHAKKNEAANRMLRSGSEGRSPSATMIARLTASGQLSPRHRAFAKPLQVPPKQDLLSAGGKDAFDEFLTSLRGRGKQLPSFMPAGTPLTTGSVNNLKERGDCRHYDSMTEELDDIRARLKKDPERTRKLLADSGSWRYWARELEVAEVRERKETHRRRLMKSHTEKVLAEKHEEPGRGPPNWGTCL